MVVVTGATGHLGNVLVRELIKEGEKVRALVLPEDDLTPLKGLDVDIVFGNILQPQTLDRAFKGARVVFHLAGFVTIERGHKKLLERVNVQGTRNVIKACERAKIRRLIYTSSVHALAHPRLGAPLTEDQPFDPRGLQGEYDRSKARATQAVLRAKKRLDVVVVCPSGAVGPYDFKVSQMAQLFIDYKTEKLKAYIEGAYDFADVRDIARGHILAAYNGSRGEAYILSGERVEVSEIFYMLYKLTRVEPPKVKFPRWFALAIAPFAFIHYRLWKLKPLFTGYSIKTLTSKYKISHDKATQELGYEPRPVEEAVKDAVEWLKKNGYFKKR